MSVLVEKGKRFYEEKLKARLEPEQNGQFVSIDPDSESFFVGKTAVEAMKLGHEAFPDKILFLARIGYPTAFKIGGGRVKRNG